MQFSSRVCGFFFAFYRVFCILAASALPQDPPTAELLARALPPSNDPKLLPIALSQNYRNTTLRTSGCYPPESGHDRISPQDAIIAIGKLSAGGDFYDITTWYSSQQLYRWEDVRIELVTVREGHDRFSKYEIAIQAIDLLWHCVIFSPHNYGGAIAIGQADVFRVVLSQRL